MKIHSVSRIRYPLSEVWLTYRDRLDELVPYIPDVRDIVVKSREEQDFGIRTHLRWVGDRELPRPLRRFVSTDVFEWDDYADWHDSENHVDWRMEFPALPGRVSCGGRNRFHADGDHTRIELTGELRIDLDRLPGVPNMVARKVGPAIEDFIVRLITPNLERTNQSLQKFLDDRS